MGVVDYSEFYYCGVHFEVLIFGEEKLGLETPSRFSVEPGAAHRDLGLRVLIKKCSVDTINSEIFKRL